MVLTTIELAAPLGRYAERFHAAIGNRHHVASPLGAWLLLAFAASAATGSLRREIEDVLGTDTASAAATAAALLGNPHPLVHSGAAAWHRPEFRTDALLAWLRSLPAVVEQGGIPSQAEADGWAREHTLGLVERFPLELGDDVVLVLASALATKLAWMVPFEVAPARELGPASAWASRLTRVLRTPATGFGATFIAATARAGDVAVVVAPARDGARLSQTLVVASVIAAPSVPPADVLAGAHEIATAFPLRGDAGRRSLFDLPLGDGHSWTVAEAPDDGSGAPERCTAVLPAWSATDDHDLLADTFGFPAALRALAALLPPASYRFEAKQSVVARYHRHGFEAAAVTAAVVRLSRTARLGGGRRVAELRFGHPFAVVAVTVDMETRDGRPSFGPWHGVPVFSAWVTEPEDVAP